MSIQWLASSSASSRAFLDVGRGHLLIGGSERPTLADTDAPARATLEPSGTGGEGDLDRRFGYAPSDHPVAR
jgi:hypothetical protein